MDYKDVRIGNWIDEQGLHLQVGMINSEVLKSAKPIPLTEDWLINFGFEYKGGVNGILQKKSSNPRRELGLFDLYEDGRVWSVMFQEDVGCGFSDLNEINTVHDLQNLYYALMGEELVLK